MKLFLKLLTTLFILSYGGPLTGQDIQISFTGTGAASGVDLVTVENLTQCTSLQLGGSDILHLVDQIGIDETSSATACRLRVSPNPCAGECRLDFETITAGITEISIYDVRACCVARWQASLQAGQHECLISGIGQGVYTVKVTAAGACSVARIVGANACSQAVQIRLTETRELQLPFDRKRSSADTKAVIEMQYNPGDLLKLTGISGYYRTVAMLTPVTDQTVNFEFMDCTDADGNHYAVVKIGDQWWMAENLNAGTYAGITTPQVSGTKFCMDVNGQADPNCPMGGLYEFANLLQGATPCNGTGAPPNDICTTPVQGLCPAGWHIPSHYEWTTLERNAGSNPGAFPYDVTTMSLLGTDEGGNLKMNCTSTWWTPNAGATNATGFSGLPGGDTWNGVFEDFGQSAYFWTSTETLFFAWVHALNYYVPVTGRSAYAVESGFSCRCIKDQ